MTGPPISASARVRDLWSFQGRYRILHLTWFAFFLSFVVWFDFAPFATTIEDQLGLTRLGDQDDRPVQRGAHGPGAYGNVGALVFLTVGILTSTRVLFLVMAVAAAAALAASRFVVEPDDSFAADLRAAPVRATAAPTVRVLAGAGVAS